MEEEGEVWVRIRIVSASERSVVAATPEARAELVRKVTAGIGFTAGDHVPAEVAVATSEQVSDGHIEVMSRLAVGPDGTTAAVGFLAEDRYIFDLHGTFLQALVSGAPAVSVQSVPVGSAAAAYDDLRHHRADLGGGGVWGPTTVGGFQLVAGARTATCRWQGPRAVVARLCAAKRVAIGQSDPHFAAVGRLRIADKNGLAGAVNGR